MPDWLTARPVAHRGLHDAANGVIENTPSAFEAAIAGNYAIECDLQLSADGEAMVHHDDVLGRLTDGAGRLDAMPAAELKRVAFKATKDRMLTLGELCALVAGRATLVIELKSQFDGDVRLPRRAAQVLAGYKGTGRCDVVRSRADRGAARSCAGPAPAVSSAWRPDTHARAQSSRPGPARNSCCRRWLVAAAIPGLSGVGPALGSARLCAQRARPAAADLDGAHAGGPPPRRAARRPDHFRGFPALR